MEAHICPFNCKVEFLSQLWVCTHQGCNLPSIRCKNCFVKIHNYIDELGKFKVHTNQKFDENQIFKNFLYFIKLYQIIQNKFQKSYGKINYNVKYYSYQIFCSSQFAKIFPSQQAFSQFYILKQIFNKRQANFTMSPSSDISNTLSLFTEKLFNNARSQLLYPTQQQALLSYYFNQASDCNSQPLQYFIAQQQIHFTQFCDKTRQTNQNFEIESYIKSRRQTHNQNKIYFSHIFQNFLQQKYSQKPQQKQLFTSSQYINYVWQNFNVICSNQELQNYLNQWIINFKTYGEYMKLQQLTPTLLAFRMWKNHVPNTGSTALHQDKYFLDTYIFAFIEYLIVIQNYSVGINGSSLNWKNFMKYLKDYVAVSKLKGEQFVDLSKYCDYYEFRTKNQNFIQFLQKSQQITFNKDYCIQYLNQAYKDNVKLSKKNYIKYLTTKQQQQKQKQIKLLQISKKLHKQLQQEQGQRFYVIIYNDYIRTCLQLNTNLTKQGYQIFKKQVLQRYSQQQIKLNNDELLLIEKQAMQANFKTLKEKQQQEGQIKKAQGKIIYEISQNEQLLANLDSDKEEEQDDICPCCEGKPQDCQKEQCQMVGFCATCSL